MVKVGSHYYRLNRKNSALELQRFSTATTFAHVWDSEADLFLFVERETSERYPC